MTNFEYVLPVFLFLLTIALVFVIAKYIRYKHLLKLARIRILRAQQKTETNFYADIVIKKCLHKLFLSFDKNKKKALADLTVGKTRKAEVLIAKKDKILAAFIEAHVNAKSAYNFLKRNKKLLNKNAIFLLLFADMAEKFFDYEQARSTLKKLKSKKLFGLEKAYYNKICAELYLKDADMLSASAKASAALKYFQKNDMPIEEAETYLLLGEIYRISCVNDVAQTMLESALKIYRKISLNLFEARTLAVLGMLMVFENRFEEAEDKFDKALKLTDLSQVKAEIYNQFALLEIARKNARAGLRFAKEANLLHEKQKNPRGMALSLQILAHLYNDKHQLKKVLDCSQKAADFYEKQQNFSAVCECVYLQATALYKLKKYKKSEENLRTILQISKKYGNSFHHANAYSLLGLIYLQKKDLQRAKVLIQQSLHLEQSNDRSSGIAADYANLALIESLRGDEDSAANDVQTALEYALKTEDEDLINLIKARI